jgi:hypothetical protein
MGWSDTAYQKQSYQQRLLLVQRHLSESLDVAPCGTVRILSMFAGDGRDVVNVLGKHPRRGEVLAWLVERNSQSVASGIRRSAEVGLGTVTTFLEKDATQYAAYHGLAPAHIVLLCGVWGHVPIRERGELIQALASLCAPGGVVIWTRGISKGITQLQQIHELYRGKAWERVCIRFTPANDWAVATYRYRGPAIDRPEQGQIFQFRTGAGTS